MSDTDIESLVETFDMNIASLKSAKNKAEAEIRKNYIDPMFASLGWNVRNTGLHEYEKEVVAEYPVQGELGTKKADYCFRMNGKDMFYVEAKDPYVNIETNRKAAFQIRSYCWSAKVPLGVLTDFEEFAVYDGGHEPKITDSTDTARINYFNYRQYKDKWNEITGIFSKEAVTNGSLDKYIKKAKRKKGIPVDETFLKDMENWRELLAVNLALRNPELSRREINFAVQRTIDRIVFLRICEDRGTEAHGRIKRLSVKRNIYPGLVNLFREADAKYNSGIFCFAAEKGRTEGIDTLTPNLNIDDSVLKTVIERLYYPSPYNFAVMPADILGQIYERFLGKVIEISPERNVSVEEKPEVRKAGGVYYTPTYIVNYIVENTVDRLVEGKTPAQVAKMRFLDPACGSGSFLIQAYQHLLNWHLAWYSENGIEKHSKGKRPVLAKDRKGSVRLSIDERKKILLNNIFGVDIDFQAVEVTKLSLLLKVLEGEDDLTMQQLGIFKERALPDLGKNIKCGNSLIGPDYYENVQMNLNDEEEILRVNVFDWNSEFAEIMGNGGFDAVIGNPPWISLSGKFGNKILTDQELSYLTNKFNGNTYMPNMYEYFVAKGLDAIRENGFFGFIVPDRLGFNDQFLSLRKRILEEYTIVTLLYKPPFPNITADTLLFVFQKNKHDKKHNIVISEYGKKETKRLQSDLLHHPDYKFEYFENMKTANILKKLDSNQNIKQIKDICDSTSGFGGQSKLICKEKKSSSQIETYKGNSIERYKIRCLYYFDFKKENITGRTADKGKLGAKPKILIRKTGDKILAAYDDSGIFPEQSLYFLYKNKSDIDFKFILGLLNSKLLTFYYQAKLLTNKKSIAQVKKKDLDLLPIIHDIKNNSDKESYHQIINLVDRILKMKMQNDANSTPQMQDLLQRQIEAADRQIDQLVYHLYRLTDEEIKTIEEGSQK